MLDTSMNVVEVQRNLFVHVPLPECRKKS